MDTVAWGALTLTLTALGAVYTLYAFRNRGVVAGLRGLGVTLIPLGLLLTSSLRMVTRIVNAVSSWVSGLAWNPFTWVGLIVLGVAMVCFVTAGVLRRRELGGAPARSPDPAKAGRTEKALPASRGRKAEPAMVDDDLADIEALLRKRGIQ